MIGMCLALLWVQLTLTLTLTSPTPEAWGADPGVRLTREAVQNAGSNPR